MERRKFLELSALSLSITACGGGSESTPPPAPMPEPTLPIVSIVPDSEWQNLANELTGELILPSDSNKYGLARLVFNVRFDDVYPEAIVRCINEKDIQHAIEFAKKHELPIVARCGSHGYTGNSTSKGIVIDVSELNSITVNEGTTTIGAGARLVDVYDQLTAQDVAIPAGSCLTVGISGLTMGGGFGVVDRAYGLTCDNLLSAEIVTANGSLITCNKEENADLFWALCGGGGGNFGIVTSFTFKTHETSDITVFEAFYSLSHLEEVMTQWQLLADIWPNEMWGQIVPSWMNSSRPTIQVRAFCLNPIEEAKIFWDDFIAQIQPSPYNHTQTTNSYRNTMLGNCSNAVATCHLSNQVVNGRMSRSAFAASSDFFAQPIPPNGISALTDFINDSISNNNLGMIIFNLLGGKIDDFTSEELAYPHREARISAEYYAPLSITTSNEAIDDTQVWQNSFRNVMAPWSTGGAYVNYLDPHIENWKYAYYGDNYSRLTQIKNKYDPEHLFKMQQGIELS